MGKFTNEITLREFIETRLLAMKMKPWMWWLIAALLLLR